MILVEKTLILARRENLLPSLMEKKSGVYRWEVNLFSTNRKPLHRLIDHLQVFLYQPKLSRKVRWAIDVDTVSTI